MLGQGAVYIIVEMGYNKNLLDFILKYINEIGFKSNFN